VAYGWRNAAQNISQVPKLDILQVPNLYLKTGVSQVPNRYDRPRYQTGTYYRESRERVRVRAMRAVQPGRRLPMAMSPIPHR
jgi:hypothetical protein